MMIQVDEIPAPINQVIVTAIIIEEVCVPHEIAELERYLTEFDPPEVPISNTATYPLGLDDRAAVESSRVLTPKEIELLPFGALPVDWKRLRVLYDLLALPEDEKLKTKLALLYKILIAANQCVRKSTSDDNHRERIPEETPSENIESRVKDDEEMSRVGISPNGKGNDVTVAVATGLTPGPKSTQDYFEDEIIDAGGPGQERRLFSTEEFGNTRTSSPATTARQRLERSTHDQDDGHADSSRAIKHGGEDLSSSLSGTESTKNFEAFSEPPETLDFDDKNRGHDAEGEEKLKGVIPQLEEEEEGEGDVRVFDAGAARAEKEDSIRTTDSYSKKTLADYVSNFASKERAADKSTEGEEARGYNREEATGFENPKTPEGGRHGDSETINEMRSFRTGAQEGVTTEEIKPEVENEDRETITTLSPRPFTPSTLLLPIDHGKITPQNFGARSVSAYYFSTPGYPAGNNNSGNNKQRKGDENNSAVEIGDSNSSDGDKTTPGSSPREYLDEKDAGISTTVSAIAGDFLNSKDPLRQFESSPELETTRKTLILRIAESFSNVPRPVEKVVSIKSEGEREGNHISRVHNFANDADLSADSLPGDIEVDFWNGRNRLVGQESGGKLSAEKLSNFGHLRRSHSPKGRHEKREGRNTGVENLYRWFYRGGETPEKMASRGTGEAEIKCKRRS